MDPEAELNLVHMVRSAPRYSRGGRPENGTPALFLLHGRGADEADLMPIEAALDDRLTIISARGPIRIGPGYAWYHMPQLGEPDDDTLRETLEELREFIDEATKAYALDPNRLYLMGFSQGAMLAAASALVMPEKARSVIMHSGYVPTHMGIDFEPGAIMGKGFFVAHGIYDDVIPVSLGRASQAYLTEQGARLTYHEYPLGHSIGEESLYELSEWLAQELDDTEPDAMK